MFAFTLVIALIFLEGVVYGYLIRYWHEKHLYNKAQLKARTDLLKALYPGKLDK